QPSVVQPSVAPPSVAPRPEPQRPTPVVPLTTGPSTALTSCPKLGFEDDPSSSFARPTRLHRCFAAGTPLPLSLDQQRELCLSEQFATCPRLTSAGAVSPPSQVAAQAADAAPAGAEDGRIVRWPHAGRARMAGRAAATPVART